MNQTEALIIARLVEDALYMGVKPSQIGVISAYRAQICVINKALERKNILYPKSEMLVGTIDAFQGGEREVVIVATTRSNKRQSIGFLSSEERMNVAVTRAKRLCVFVGSAATLIKAEDSFIKEFYEFTRTHGEVLWYDRHKGTFKKANTSTQMSKPAVPSPKLDKSDYAASFSTAPNSKHNNLEQPSQNLPRNHYEMVPVGRGVISPWQPDSVPAQHHDYRQPAASSISASGAVIAPQQPDWQVSGWSPTPDTYQRIPNSDHGLAPMWTHPTSRTNGSEMSIIRTRPEARYIKSKVWISFGNMIIYHYASAHSAGFPSPA